MRVPLIEVGYCKEEGGWMVVVVEGGGRGIDGD